jgi:hypothetical protein
MEGRETGMRGQKLAADYLVSRYAGYHLSPVVNPCGYDTLSFLQKHYLSLRYTKGSSLSAGSDNFLYGKDFIYLRPDADTVLFVNNILFLANRSENIENVLSSDRYSTKNLMIYDSESLIEKLNLISQNKPWPGVVLVITGDEQIFRIFNCKSGHTFPFPVIYINEKIAETLVGKDQYEKLKRKGKKKSLIRQSGCELSLGMVHETSALNGENVVAMLKGTDTNAGSIIISSHYDHLGKKDSLVYYGADDNASGTSAVIELARIFTMAARQGYRPKRNIIFLNVSGEEKGLLGSSYFVSHSPIPLNNIEADLNIDMIGRTDSIHDSTGVSDYVYVIGADRLSSELNSINERQNSLSVRLNLDYKYNAADDPNNFYRRSDHYNFARNGIPVIFYFDGKHADYHLPADVPSKINFDLLTKRARLIFLTAWELANRNDRIIVDKK